MQAHPSLPVELDPAPAALGRLGPWLHALARAQGAWPPVPPSRIRSVAGVEDWEAGLVEGDRLVDEGADLVVVRGGDPVGPALALLAVLLRLDPVAAVGTAGAPGWVALITEVRAGLRAARTQTGHPVGIVEAVGAARIAGLAGVVAQCAVRRTPVLLSSAPDAVAAAVLAQQVAPGSASWVLPASTGTAGAARAGLLYLGATPLLDLELPGPDGADLVLAMLPAAVGLAAGLPTRPVAAVTSMPVQPSPADG